MGTVPLSPPGTLAVGNPSEGREQWDAGQARQSSLLSGAPRNFQCPEVSGCLSPKCCPYLLCLCGTIRDSDGKSFRVRSSWALSTAQTWLMVEPAQHRQFLGRTCSHSCLEGLTVLGKGLTLTLQGILGDTHSGEIQELKGEVVVVKSSPLNHPLIREQHELPHPCPAGSRARREVWNALREAAHVQEQKPSPGCQGRAFISQPAQLGGAQLKGSGASEPGQGWCCTAGQGEDSIVPVSLLGQSPAPGLPLGVQEPLRVSGLAAVPPSRAGHGPALCCTAPGVQPPHLWLLFLPLHPAPHLPQG